MYIIGIFLLLTLVIFLFCLDYYIVERKLFELEKAKVLAEFKLNNAAESYLKQSEKEK